MLGGALARATKTTGRAARAADEGAPAPRSRSCSRTTTSWSSTSRRGCSRRRRPRATATTSPICCRGARARARSSSSTASISRPAGWSCSRRPRSPTGSCPRGFASTISSGPTSPSSRAPSPTTCGRHRSPGRRPARGHARRDPGALRDARDAARLSPRDGTHAPDPAARLAGGAPGPRRRALRRGVGRSRRRRRGWRCTRRVLGLRPPALGSAAVVRKPLAGGSGRMARRGPRLRNSGNTDVAAPRSRRQSPEGPRGLRGHHSGRSRARPGGVVMARRLLTILTAGAHRHEGSRD